jgi:hypothetical protein
MLSNSQRTIESARDRSNDLDRAGSKNRFRVDQFFGNRPSRQAGLFGGPIRCGA